jgi:hypothetical protein
MPIKSSQVTLAVCQLGQVARQRLRRAQALTVLGLTRRGVFLRVGRTGVVFLSREPFRGPLTLNVAPPAAGLERLALGLAGRSVAGALEFESGQLCLNYAAAVEWRPPPAPAWTAAARARLTALAQPVLERQPDNQWLADALAETPAAAAVRRLRQALTAADWPTAQAVLAAGLGRGRGLTPTGDDVALGVLLALNRPRRPKSADLRAFNRHLLASARRATTHLSAALIAAAAAGQADERLLAALDFALTGRGDAAQMADGLLSWGASSGGEALAGMLVALEQF